MLIHAKADTNQTDALSLSAVQMVVMPGYFVCLTRALEEGAGVQESDRQVTHFRETGLFSEAT